nr:retrotransposable element Tf2 [Tanacetum cinerariifolium]
MPSHTHHNGLVFFQGRLLIPNIPDLRHLILEEFHASTLGGHSGIQATTRCLLSSLFWPTLKQDVIDYIKKCSTCQATKYPTHKPYGLLQAFPTPSKPWTDITMDFITHLPPSNEKTTIWVIVDRLSKFSHFTALPSQNTATTLAAIFLKDIYRLHGIPNSITSEATWEDWLEFMHRFPVFVGHEDMSAVNGETNDTPEPSATVQAKAAQDKSRPTRIIKKPSRYLE